MSLLKNRSESERIQQLIARTIFANKLVSNTRFQGGCNQLPRSIESGSGAKRDYYYMNYLKVGEALTPISTFNTIVESNTCAVAGSTATPGSQYITVDIYSVTVWETNPARSGPPVTDLIPYVPILTISAGYSLTVPTGFYFYIQERLGEPAYQLVNNGLFIVNGAVEGTTKLRVPIINNGTIIINSGGTIYIGDMTTLNGLENNGTIIINTGGTLDVTSGNGGVNLGVLKNFNSGIIIISGGGLRLFNRGSLDNSGVVYNNNGGTIQVFTGGIVTNTGIINNPVVDSGCGVGTLIGSITANGTACPV